MTRNWETEFSKAVDGTDVAKALRILQGQATAHAGTPPLAVKERALKILLSRVNGQRLNSWVTALVELSSPIAKELACGLLPQLRERKPALVHRLMTRLADDPSWEVRESAAGLLAAVLAADFVDVYPLFERLATHPSPNIRRAVAMAVKYVAKQRTPEWGPALLRLIEPLLSNREEYVRKNLGPFALGDGFLRYYPELTLNSLKRWARSKDETIRWNVAMCLSTAEARKHLESGLKILHGLAADGRPFVFRAVAAAVRRHAQVVPQAVMPVLKSWSGDPKRKHVAELVLKNL